MRKSFTIIVAVLLAASAFAQSPEKMSYQAVVRDAGDNLVTNQSVGMRISILQGTASGTAVYIETQTPTTNANGLVSIEIGAGTLVSGNFSTIDWANDSYFIKTETDPAGGISYSITGTSQLISVPYALHAKTTETVTGTITETDPVYSAWDKDYADLINTPTAPDGSETKVTAGTNVTVTGSGTSANPYVINATGGATTLTIGQFYQGGIIFWLDATGQHGLIADTTDQSAGIRWYNGQYRYTGTSGDGLYAGVMNTALIVATQMLISQAGSFAAKVCADYSVTDNGVTYGDWYLPSQYELNLLYLQKTAVGNFAGIYWSSTEYNSQFAWFQNFDNGFQLYEYKDVTYKVRAVRAF
jgi:hypothetical protein